MSDRPAATPVASQTMANAMALHRAGRLATAAALYQQVLRRQPAHPDALRLLGVVRAQQGNLDDAASLMRQSLTVDPLAVETHNNLGRVLHDLGRYDEAVVAYEAAILLRPAYPIALNNLGTTLAASQRQEEAAERYRQALVLDPEYAEALNNLGAALHALGRSKEAVDRFQAALRSHPGFFDAEVNLAKVLDALDRPEEAIRHYRIVTAAYPADPQLQLDLASALRRVEQYEEAEPCYRRAIQHAPNLARAHLGLGNLLLELGRLAEAVASIERAIALEPSNLRLYLPLARAKKFVADDAHLEAMLALVPTIGALGQDDQVDAHYAMGSALADLGRHDVAYVHIAAGSRLKRSMIQYDEPEALRRIGRIGVIFSRDVVNRGRVLNTSSSLPVFIVGMPRSGSTLVEQILASHPSVFAAGEINAFRDTLREMGSQRPGSSLLESVGHWKREQFVELETRYLHRIEAVARKAGAGDGVTRITDKMLENFRHIGLIHMAMPNARIIHTYRDPVDTCLSCFSIQFNKVKYSYDLGELGRYYGAYFRLMRHWREVLPKDAMLEVCYEDVVADLEGQACRLVAHCGLPWDDACLDFHEAKRPVRTASVRQVRQPIYRSSVGRWRPDKATLRPLLEALGMENGSAA